MLTRVTAKGFGCLRDVSVDLTPVHAFIGPNDSGKSTLLRAIQTVSLFAQGDIVAGTALGYRPPPGFRPIGTTWLAARAESAAYELYWDEVGDGLHEFFPNLPQLRSRPGRSAVRTSAQAQAIAKQFGPCALVRLDPDRLRLASPLVPDDQLASFFDSRGRGLPGLYMRVLGEADGSFGRLRNDLVAKFPTVAGLRVPTVSAQDFQIEITLTSGEVIQAPQMSEGMLYYLAFAVLPYLRPFRILLVEEPENGLHPSRIADVMKILKGLAEGPNAMQVIIATHSPLVINELAPDQVSLVTRSPEKGTKVTPIAQTKNFEQRKEVYALGELWLSYADGIDESELVG